MAKIVTKEIDLNGRKLKLETGKLAMQGSEYQMTINIYMANITSAVNSSLSKNPSVIWVLAALIAAAVLFLIFMKNKRKGAGGN